MAVYQLNRPDIETIIDYCNDLDAGEKLEVFEFGKDCDLVHIYKDEGFDREKDGIFTTLLPSALPETANGSMIPGIIFLLQTGIVPRACQNL